MIRHYLLDGHNAVECGAFDLNTASGAAAFFAWLESGKTNCSVARSIPVPGIEVCTSFVGIDSGREGPFETVAFIGPADDCGNGDYIVFGRCRTWEEAESMHACAVQAIKQERLRW